MRFKWIDNAQVRVYDEDNIFVERWFVCDEVDLEKIEDRFDGWGYEVVVERYDIDESIVTGKVGRFCWDLEEAQRERKILEEVIIDVQS